MKLIIALIAFLSISNVYAETTFSISLPSHTESGLPISMNSNADGVCKYFHFGSAVRGSMKAQGHLQGHEQLFSDRIAYTMHYFKNDSVVLGSDGDVIRQKNGKVIDSITCLNP